MEFGVEGYHVALLLVGTAALAAALLPRLVAHRPMSYPLVYLVMGVAVFLLPLPIEIDLRSDTALTERLTELSVIIALMGVGLKIERALGWRSWSTTWRLLAITMPLSIAGAALLGWWALGLAPATAMLLGAAMAPTDPVLASDVQIKKPDSDEAVEDEVRFALTSEAGFNDGLAFPFTSAAIAMATYAGPAEWLPRWIGVAIVYKIVMGVVVGALAGRAMALLIFQTEVGTRLARSTEGLVVLAVTLLAYAAAELAQGYGFLAVFIAALVLRRSEARHDYHQVLHDFSDQAERFALALVVLLFGGTIAHGLFSDITWVHVAVAVAIALVIRPAFGLLAMVGSKESWPSRALIAIFGIKGIGSLYYLAYALERADFPAEGDLWMVVGATILTSMVVHGIAATPVMRRFDQWRGAAD